MPTWTVGVVTHAEPNLGAHYFRKMLQGIRQGLEGFPYQLLINPPIDAADGLLFLAPSTSKAELLEQTLRKKIPAIVVNGVQPGFPSIDLDNVKAAQQAVSHLLKLGHRRVAAINGKMGTANGRDRFQGYRQALSDFGLDFDSELVGEGDFDVALGGEAMERLLARARDLTAVFAANDRMAVGALETLRARGRQVPKDVGVVGFDDAEFAASTEPPLTTIRQPLFEMGELASKTLWGLLGGKRADTKPVLFEGVIVVRDSCGAKSFRKKS